MSEKITYLCGGINGLSDSDCRDWRALAKGLLRTATLDPIRRDYRGLEDQAVNEIVQGDISDIRTSDFVLVNATKASWGTAMEIVYARALEKFIVAFVSPGARVSPWLRYHCGPITASLEEAVERINGLL